MNLQFTNKGGNFVSEFEVTSDFNLHIEGVRLSDMHIYQKTAGGSYAKVTDFPSERSQDRVADFDFASLVYPKFIKVVCATEPTYAEIATDGEVTEIKSQSKEVEITSNGVTEIAPDAGFGYLSGVKVNVNVPQSGGGDAPSQPSGGNMEYYNVNNNGAFIGEIGLVFTQMRYDYNGELYIASMIDYYKGKTGTVYAISIDRTMKIMMDSETITTVGEFLVSIGLSDFSALGWVKITEEEFYNLGA